MATGYVSSNDGNVSGNNGSLDIWVVKGDSTGAFQWGKCLGGSEEDFGKTILQTADGGFLVCGESSSNDGDVSGHHGATAVSDVWLAKLSPLPTGLNEPEGNIASFSIAPNPVTSNATLSFELMNSDHIQIALFDLSGRLVQTISDRKINAGTHSVDINTQAMELENGIYLVRVAGANSVMTTKLIKN